MEKRQGLKVACLEGIAYQPSTTSVIASHCWYMDIRYIVESIKRRFCNRLILSRKGCFLQLCFFCKKCVLKSSRPSLPLKKAPPLISIFSPQGRRGKPPSGARNRFASWLSDHQRSAPCFAGWDRMGKAVYSLLFTVDFVVIC